MLISHFSFGALEIDGVPYDHDIIIDRYDCACVNARAFG